MIPEKKLWRITSILETIPCNSKLQISGKFLNERVNLQGKLLYFKENHRRTLWFQFQLICKHSEKVKLSYIYTSCIWSRNFVTMEYCNSRDNNTILVVSTYGLQDEFQETWAHEVQCVYIEHWFLSFFFRVCFLGISLYGFTSRSRKKIYNRAA